MGAIIGRPCTSSFRDIIVVASWANFGNFGYLRRNFERFESSLT